MMTRQSPRFQAAMERSRDPDGFARLRSCCADNPGAAPLMTRLALYRAATIMACKGGLVTDIAVGDCVELLDTQSQVQAKGGTCKTYFYQLLHDAQIFPPEAPATVRAFRSSTGQLSVEELVDRYHLACRPIRDLIVEYLRERQPVVDYTTLNDLASHLANSFWRDLECHHPGIDSLNLTSDVTHAWKQRNRIKTTTTVDPQTGSRRPSRPRGSTP